MPIVRAEGKEIAWEEHGAGEPLVLISGIGLQLISWPSGFIEKLVAKGYRVIVFDNRDMGQSTKYDELGVPDMRRLMTRALLGRPVTVPYTLFDMADDVALLFREIGLAKAKVCGMSLGGMIAQAFALTHPELVERLVLMMTFCGSRRFPGKPKAVSRFLARPPRNRDEAALLQLDFFRTAGSTKYGRDEVALMERARKAYDRSPSYKGFPRQFAAAVALGDLRPRLADLKVPTLVMHGQADPIFRPVCARDTAAAIPGSKLTLIDGWGHDLAEGIQDLLVGHIHGHLSNREAS